MEVFKTPWLDRGGGFVLESGKSLAGFGWARDAEWNGGRCIDFGLYIGQGFRAPDGRAPLTNALLELTRELGARYRVDRAVANYRSIDDIHPPIIRALGFKDLRTSMVGFRHDLEHIPATELPPGIKLRNHDISKDNKPLLDLARNCFSDRARQGEPLDAEYWDMIPRLPGFSPEQVLVAESGGTAVGYALLQPGAKPILAEIGVLPKWRRKGIGSAMIGRTLELCRVRRRRAVLVSCFSTNRAGTTFWRLGFRPDPLRSFFFFSRPIEPPDCAEPDT